MWTYESIQNASNDVNAKTIEQRELILTQLRKLESDEYFNESDDIRSEYAFNSTTNDSCSEVESVYAFENIDETEDGESVYAFEGMQLSDFFGNIDGHGVEAETQDQIEEIADNTMTEATTMEDTRELFLLGCLTLTLAFLALICRLCNHLEFSYVFGSPAFLFLSCFGFNYFDDLRMKALQRRIDLQWAESARLVPAEADEANADVASAYAYDANVVDEDSDSEIDTTDTEETTDSSEDDSELAETDDDAASVHTFDAFDDDDVSDSSVLTSDEDEFDTTEAENAIEDTSESAQTTESKSPFGFNITNLGLIVNGEYQNEEYCFYFTENSTIFETKDTGETLYLFFESQSLEFVLYRGEEYHSFGALPSKVADLLITARTMIVALKH